MEKIKSKSINGAVFRKMLLSGAKLLDINKEHVDALNVFPVPDGDTGTNMSLTMMSLAREVTNCSSNNFDELCAAMSKGALKGARGNSGVILSQIIKGIADTLVGVQSVTPKLFAKALEKGTEVAYKAVTKPQEGTILTVVRGMSEAAKVFVKKSVGLEEFFEFVLQEGEKVLKTTP
ncbi:MAG: DAK2 domain-containing protein, partial [Firmicutes bacterium]|nr:DAK2 domain-containing protein [Bacillota bacterium]